VQDGIASFATSRTVTPWESRSYSIAAFSDAHCGGNMSGAAFIDVIATGSIAEQPRSQTIARGETATLMIDANGIGLQYDWYEALPDGSRLVASGRSPLFTTPSLTKTTTYWVEVVNSCGVLRSSDAIVTIPGRRRSARH
jgi:hypothetical protein